MLHLRYANCANFHAYSVHVFNYLTADDKVPRNREAQLLIHALWLITSDYINSGCSSCFHMKERKIFVLLFKTKQTERAIALLV